MSKLYAIALSGAERLLVPKTIKKGTAAVCTTTTRARSLRK